MKKHTQETWLCEPGGFGAARRREHHSNWPAVAGSADLNAPPQRVARYGVAALSDAELVALLLTNADAGTRELPYCLNLLARAGGMKKLLELDTELLERLGLERQEALRFQAAAEIRRRLTGHDVQEAINLRQPEMTARHLTLIYEHLQQEVLGALFLNAKHELVASRELFRGTRDRVAPDFGLILREALVLATPYIVLFHNHPSGDPTPSSEDILLTRRFAEAARTVGFKLIDHFVLGSQGRWTSLRAHVIL